MPQFYIPGVKDDALERVYVRLATFNNRPTFVPDRRIWRLTYRDGAYPRTAEVGRIAPKLFRMHLDLIKDAKLGSMPDGGRVWIGAHMPLQRIDDEDDGEVDPLTAAETGLTSSAAGAEPEPAT